MVAFEGLRKMKTSSSRDNECQIIDMIINQPREFKAVVIGCYETFRDLGDVSEDRLKRQAIYEQVLKTEG